MSDTAQPRSFTIRTPHDLYCEVAELARKDGVSMTKKVEELIRLGLDKHVDIDEKIVRLLREKITEDQK